MIASSALQVRGWYLFMLLILPFAATYATCMFRALQIQAYRREQGQTRVHPSVIALAGIAPMTVLPLWPLGLVAFGAVLRYRAAEQADAADEAQGGTRTAGQGAALCPRRRGGRGHRFAADPRCSTDL
jgi:hypothetical protein